MSPDGGEPGQYSLAAVSEAIAERMPDHLALIFRDRRLTHAQLCSRTRQLAFILESHGLGAHPVEQRDPDRHESHQDHLAICASNGNEYLEAMVGSFKARVVPINVNYRYIADELRYILENSRVKAVIYQSKFASTLAEVLPGLPEVSLLLQIDDGSGALLLPGAQWYEQALAGAPTGRPDCATEWSADDLYILYTGGTTGTPKGVVWRHGDIFRTAMGGRHPLTRQPWADLEQLAEFAATNPSPRVVLAASPFMHGAGHWTALLGLNQGGTVAIQDDVEHLDAVDICRVIERERVTYLQMIGDAFARPIVEEMEKGAYDMSSLRTVLSGGTALSEGMKSRLLERLRGITLIESVGSSEAGGQAVQVTNAGGAISTGTFTPIEGSVVVSADRSRILSPGEEEIGWLAKRGDIPLGYLGDAERTTKAFPVVSGVRVVIPGDRAYWLADGTIQLLGRDGATINSGGEKIFAEEIEAAITRHPEVADVAVSSRPSERWGQEVVAIVRLQHGAWVSETELASEAARHVATLQAPKDVDIRQRRPSHRGRKTGLSLGS